MTSGGTPSKSNPAFWGGSIPWLSAKDMKTARIYDTEDHVTALGAANGTRVAKEGATLLLVRGMTLLSDVPICSAGRDLTFNQDVKALVAKPGVDPDFLFYSVLAAKPELLGMVDLAGHGTGRLPTDRVQSLPVWVPELTEQRAIASALRALDAKIDLNRQMNTTLETTARALFKSWFVDFDPVRARAEGRAPAGMDAATARLFPDGFERSEIGDIPRGWHAGAYGPGLTVVKGKSYKSDELQPSRTALVTLKSFLRGGGYRADGLKEYVGPCKLEQVVNPGEVVVAFTDVTQAAEVIGRPARIRADERYERLVASLDVGIIRPSAPELPPNFLYYCFLEPAFRDHTYAHSNGSTVLHLAAGAVEKYVGLWPSVESASAFAALVRPFVEHQDANWRQSDGLAALRNALLPRLLSGELRVRDAEKAVEQVA